LPPPSKPPSAPKSGPPANSEPSSKLPPHCPQLDRRPAARPPGP
jgi:hypothetical protein